MRRRRRIIWRKETAKDIAKSNAIKRKANQVMIISYNVEGHFASLRVVPSIGNLSNPLDNSKPFCLNWPQSYERRCQAIFSD